LRSINNRYGHLAGDAVLVAVADSFNASMRDYDLCARFGGDEFVILLPETPANQALEIAERVKAAVGRTELKHDDSDLPIGISVGVATLGPHDQSLADLMRRADTGTYTSKAAGGHAVSFAAAS
jgi:diguanylate cyclase (GGDEF)-like protein